MKEIVLGKSGIRTVQNAFGVLPIQRVDMETAVKILRRAWEGGIRFYDTARDYTDSESKLGAAFFGAHGLHPVQGLGPDDLCQKGEEIVPGLVGRDAVPGLQPGVVDAFLGVGVAAQKIPGKGVEPGPVSFRGGGDGRLVPAEKKLHDPGVVHGVLLSA